MKIKELKKGEYFTFKQYNEPDSNQVYVRDEYDRSSRKYGCHKFGDWGDYRLIMPDKEVYTNFIF